jgi:ATP-dependent protease ClpP protease subunit
MPEPASNYRPNPSRSISVIGEFNDDLAEMVLPQILKLRQESNLPITVFIHSRGGQTTTLEAIDRALQTSHYGVASPRIITVALGNVSSSGASLLLLGDYAIAYPGSELWFHGVRVGEIDVTVEHAQKTAGRLARLNRKISQRIARQVVRRIMFRFLQVRSNLTYKGKLQPCDWVKLFVAEISGRLGQAAEELLKRTCNKVEGASSLSEKVLPTIKFSKTHNPKRDDPKVLRALLQDEIKNAKGKAWELDEAGMGQLIRDYFLLRSFHEAQADPIFYQVIGHYGPDFFSPKEARQFGKLKAQDNDKAMQFLTRISHPYLAHFWYFTATLSDNLFTGENQISATDAYWMGLIDEVMGTKLKCERSVFEVVLKSKPASSALPPVQPNPPALGAAAAAAASSPAPSTPQT